MTQKYPRYQDYVIREGRLIGEFEAMYRDFKDPWEQTTREEFASEKAIALNAITALRPNTVLELGCGLGCFTRKIKARGVPNVIGVDISETAIKKASSSTNGCLFEIGDILDLHLYEKYRPDIIVMAEITWYVLDKLAPFLEFMRLSMPQTYIIHLLNTYPPGEQKYGSDYFTSLSSILKFFSMNYAEYGEIHKPFHGNTCRTYFLGRYAPLDPDHFSL